MIVVERVGQGGNILFFCFAAALALRLFSSFFSARVFFAGPLQTHAPLLP
jgi:hypothetical protein